MLAESLSVKEVILEIILIIRDEDEYLGKAIDAVFQLPAVHQDALVAYFMDSVGQDSWTESSQDPMLYPEFFKALIVFYSGRLSTQKEPDRMQLITLLEGYLESKFCHNIVNESGKIKLRKLMEKCG